ncbi:hypothetical protein [Thioflavicoccus mobilis]|uniref:hypothetical protein n=1 Tax=Thioflavicoccus mobilis TaxID=80679 RepID=UPI00030A7F99|nr:hypothetical protein [Thioflavicoccus mobilis]
MIEIIVQDREKFLSPLDRGRLDGDRSSALDPNQLNGDLSARARALTPLIP